MGVVEQIEELEQQLLTLKQQRAKLMSEYPAEPVGDYVFKRPNGQSVSLRDLFGDKSDLLAVHNMGQSCVYCTLWADGLTGFAPHILDRTAFVLVSPDQPETLKAFSESRNWNYPTVSMDGNSFAADLGFFKEQGYWPGVSALHKNDDGSIVRVGKSFFGPGDDFCSVWPLFDLLKEGSNGWEPKYKYS